MLNRAEYFSTLRSSKAFLRSDDAFGFLSIAAMTGTASGCALNLMGDIQCNELVIVVDVHHAVRLLANLYMLRCLGSDDSSYLPFWGKGVEHSTLLTTNKTAGIHPAEPLPTLCSTLPDNTTEKL